MSDFIGQPPGTGTPPANAQTTVNPADEQARGQARAEGAKLSGILEKAMAAGISALPDWALHKIGWV